MPSRPAQSIVSRGSLLYIHLLAFYSCQYTHFHAINYTVTFLNKRFVNSYLKATSWCWTVQDWINLNAKCALMNSNNHPVFTKINASGVTPSSGSEPTKSTGGRGGGGGVVGGRGWGVGRRGTGDRWWVFLVILPLRERGAVLIQLKTLIGFEVHIFTLRRI